MITIKYGNIFNSKMQTLVNTINCKSVMGKGLALQFKNQFPEMFRDYVERCQQKLVKIGEPYLYIDKNQPYKPWILNFPTKFDWRHRSCKLGKIYPS